MPEERRYIYCPECGEKIYEDVDGDFLCDHGTGDYEVIDPNEEDVLIEDE